VRRRSGLIAFAAVLGPGVLAGLSDDDPAGITTYSILGADYGYELLWVLLLSTVALMVFHELGMRMGVATGQGLTGLVRQRFGVRAAGIALATLVVANIGTTCAEIGVSLLVMRGGFKRVEHVLLALATVFGTYIVAGLLAGPDWSATARGLVVPSLPASTAALVAATATVGTTLAPWGLAFIQSYAVDKRLTADRLRYERVDVFVGALMTGIIGVFVVIACAATLFPQGQSIDSAADAATALEPLAGEAASLLFGAGLLAAALLAASILPLSTAYSITETLGYESALDDPVREAPLFYGSYALIVTLGASIVLIPGAPLIPLLYLTQALNAVLLLPLLVFLWLIARDRRIMGPLANGRLANWAQLAVLVLVALCVGALAVLAAGG
jgi:Mn2+/Fe2+ NRAMP family transporter